MGPNKHVTLANAGRKLTGPPEGYGRKKELQIRQWLTQHAPPDDLAPDPLDPIPSPRAFPEDVEQLYYNMRDSTDGYILLQQNRSQQQLSAFTASTPTAAATVASNVPAAILTKPAQVPAVAAVAGQGTLPDSPAAATSSPTLSTPMSVPRPTVHNSLSIGNNPTFDMDLEHDAEGELDHTLHTIHSMQTGRVTPSSLSVHPTTTPAFTSPSPSQRPISAPPYVPTNQSSPHTRQSHQSGLPPLNTSTSVKPLEFVLDPTQQFPQGVAIEAGLLLARFEASKEPGASEEAVLKLALQTAIADKHKYMREVQLELAAARSAAASAQQEAAGRVSELEGVAALQRKRAEEAEEQLRAVQVQALQVKQKVSAKMMEVDEKESDLVAQISQMQVALKEATEQLHQQAQRHKQETQNLTERLQQMQHLAASSDREATKYRTLHSSDRTILEAQLATTRQTAATLESELRRAEEHLAEVNEQLREQSFARVAAEENERHALKTLAAHTSLAESLQAARSNSSTLQRRAASATVRAAAAALPDPLQALLPEPGTPPGRAASARASDHNTTAASKQRPRSASATRTSSSSPLRPSSIPSRTATAGSSRRLSLGQSSSPAAPQAAARTPRSRAPSPTGSMRSSMDRMYTERPLSAGARARDVSPTADAAHQRVRQYRALQAALMAERRVLGEAQRTERRAQAHAELEESRQVDAALAAAPERLRVASLAFRAYLITMPPAPGSLTAQLATSLAKNYRLFIDPTVLTPQAQTPADKPTQLPAIKSSPRSASPRRPSHIPADLPPTASGGLINVSAAVMCIAVKGLLTHPLQRAEMLAAATRDARLILITPAAMLSPDDLFLADPSTAAGTAAGTADGNGTGRGAGTGAGTGTGTGASASTPPGVLGGEDSRMREYVSAVWAMRIVIPSSSADVGLLVDEVASTLGLTDEQLALLPASALKRLGRCRPVDLLHLNCATLTSLNVNLSGVLGGKEAGSGAGKAALIPSFTKAICTMLSGNTTLHHLHITATPLIAEAIATSYLASPTSNLNTLTLSSLLHPIAALTGRSHPPLDTLDLSTPGLQPEDITLLSILLPHARSLTSILLPPHETSLSLPPSYRRKLATALSSAPSLQTLNGTPLAPLISCPNFILDLPSHDLGPFGSHLVLHRLTLPPYTPTFQTLKGINLTGCGLTDTAIAPLTTLLSTSPPPALIALCLGDNMLGAEGAAQLAPALAALAAAAPIGLLELSVNSLGDDGCRMLAAAIGAMTSLKRLALASNGISTDGARALAARLPALKQLSGLQLQGNLLGDAGLAALAPALAALPSLQILNVAENYHISADGARLLAGWLAGSTSVTALHLAKNNLGQEGAKHLAAGLKSNTSLRILDLEWCKLRAEGLEHIASALSTNSTLEELGLARNSIGDRGVKFLVQAMMAGGLSALLTLDLRGNNIALTGCRLLNGVLQSGRCVLRCLRVDKNSAEDSVLRSLEELAACPRTHPGRTPHRPPSSGGQSPSHPSTASQRTPTYGARPHRSSSSVGSSAHSSHTNPSINSPPQNKTATDSNPKPRTPLRRTTTPTGSGGRKTPSTPSASANPLHSAPAQLTNHSHRTTSNNNTTATNKSSSSSSSNNNIAPPVSAPNTRERSQHSYPPSNTASKGNHHSSSHSHTASDTNGGVAKVLNLGIKGGSLGNGGGHAGMTPTLAAARQVPGELAPGGGHDSGGDVEDLETLLSRYRTAV